MAAAIGQEIARDLEARLEPVAPQDSLPETQPETANQGALLAAALFAAGLTCFVVIDRRSPESPAEPRAELPPSPELQSPLVPFSLRTPAEERGPLVPFVLPSAAVAPSETAAPKFIDLPFGAPALAGLKADRQDTEPMIEKAKVASVFNDLRLRSLGGVQREADPVVLAHAASMARCETDWKLRRQEQIAAERERLRRAHGAPARVNMAPVMGLGRWDVIPTEEFQRLFSRARYLPNTRYRDLLARDPGAKVVHGRIPENTVNSITEMSDGTLYATHSPLVFDLSGAGVRTSNKMIRFDVDGKGRLQRINDIASGTAVLVFDADKDGVAGEHARELFGDRSDIDGDGKPEGYADGFEALAALVLRAETERVLPVGSAKWGRLMPGDLAALHKAYGLGLRRGGLLAKAVSPKDAGVAEIALTTDRSVRTTNFDGQGNDVVRRDGASFVRADGSIGAYEDIFFRYGVARLLSVARK